MDWKVELKKNKLAVYVVGALLLVFLIWFFWADIRWVYHLLFAQGPLSGKLAGERYQPSPEELYCEKNDDCKLAFANQCMHFPATCDTHIIAMYRVAINKKYAQNVDRWRETNSPKVCVISTAFSGIVDFCESFPSTQCTNNTCVVVYE